MQGSKPKLCQQESSSSIEIDDEELKEVLSSMSLSESERVEIPIELVDSSSKHSNTIEVQSSSSSLNLLEFGQRKKPPVEKRSIIF